MHEPGQKCEKQHYFKQKYALKPLFAFKNAYFLLFQFMGNSFKISTTGTCVINKFSSSIAMLYWIAMLK